ncbi:MAG: bifunctional UDP-2,4-diacetamido-2,4,6-trideoxy-beta-L-altropyranose hydrolase/GNAT family N-acetyltransferase [Actinomycetota bacterium]
MQVLLLCDGGGSMGVGHVIRSLALAEAAVAGGHDVVVAGHFEGSFVRGQLAAAQVEVVRLAAPLADHDLQPVIDLVSERRPDVVHVDSYEAPARLRELGELVLSNVEDGSFGRRTADVVVDPTLGAELVARPDDGSTATCLLLRGSRYAPMRQRVIDARRMSKAIGEVARRVLVVMGGTDPVGLAPAAVKLLASTGLALEVTVIAVGENAERARVAAHGSALSLSILAPVDDLAAMMSGQDLVVSAAGTSVWELCCIGVPMALVWAVDNQLDGYDRMVASGAAVGLGGPELADAERHRDERAVGLLRTALTDSRRRADLARAGRDVVDGLGAWRVVRTWEQALRVGPAALPRSISLTARPAGMDDARLLWQWRNDPTTRAGARSSAEVTWDEHVGWLTASLARSDRVLLVVEHALVPVGTVRWDLDGKGEWEVSITVAPERRGQSLARPVLDAGEMALSKGTEVTAYLAVVHVDNAASVRLFESSAYVSDLPPDPRGFMRYRKVAPVA